MITGGEIPSKMSKRCAASSGVIPKIRGPQMHKHTKRNFIKSNEHWGLSNGLQVLKTKSFFFKKEKGSLSETPMTGFHIWQLYV